MNQNQITEYSATEAALADLRERYEGATYDIATKDGASAAREARAEIRGWRVDLEKERKRIKSPALARCKAIDAEARRITAELEALERPIHDQITAEERRKKEERLAAERAEAECVRAVAGAIADAGRVVVEMALASSAEIEAAAKALKEQVYSEEIIGDRLCEVIEARESALAQLRGLYAAKVEAEEQADEIRRMRAEKDAAEREAADREAAARRIAEERKIQMERERIEKERREAEAEDRRREEVLRAAQREEAERIEAIAREERRVAAEAQDARDMLALFVERFGDVVEFSAIAATISDFLRGES